MNNYRTQPLGYPAGCPIMAIIPLLFYGPLLILLFRPYGARKGPGAPTGGKDSSGSRARDTALLRQFEILAPSTAPIQIILRIICIGEMARETAQTSQSEAQTSQSEGREYSLLLDRIPLLMPDIYIGRYRP